MPDNKKTTKKSGSGAGKKSASANKHTNTRTTTTAKKTEKAAPKQMPMREPNPVLRQATPYILAMIGVLLGVCVVIGEGKIGGGIRDLLTGLFSGAAYLVPILLLVRAFLWNRDAEEGQSTARSVCLAFVLLLIAMLLHVIGGGAEGFALKTHFANGVALAGGGVFGGILGELCLMGFGKVCTILLLVIAALILGLYVAGLTPRSLLIYIAYKIRFAGERREERRAVAKERKKQAPPTRNRVKEEEYLAYLREKKQRDRAARETAERERQASAPVKQRMTPQPGRVDPAATVYRVKKRRLADLDIPVDDITPPVQEELVLDPMEAEAAEQAAAVEAALADTAIDQAAVDEKIFDEVMKRTRERIEKSRRAEDLRADTPVQEMPAERKRVEIPTVTEDFAASDADLPEEIRAGDVLDAVEMATYELREKAAQQTSVVQTDAAEAEVIPFDPPAETVAEASTAASASTFRPAPRAHEEETDTVKLVTGDGEDFDVTKIFVNPADAELLDKLSEAYRQPLDVQRTTISAPTQAPVKPQKPSTPPYQFPPTDILAEAPRSGNENIKEELQENAVKLVDTLRSFNVKTKIENISRGPTITRYELLPEPGTRVRSIVNLVDDIALNLATTGVRIEAPIPGKSAVGIEVPNKKQTTVHLRSLIEDSRFVDAKSSLTVALGEDVAGEAVYFDIAKMPHLLIAGATGSGKSVCINSIITSLLYKASPEDVKLILIDPKKVELSIYNGIPHLLVPVVSEPKKAAGSLSWAVGEMERRYGLIEAVGVRDIKGFNEITKNDPDYEYMPRIVIVIDELADLMMTAPDDVEDSICRIAQKARAAGMHLIIGTQRPSVDVITGLIKANVPSRIAFRTSSQIDSRTIIDVGHAANLIGMGDMLFNPVGALKPRRVQGAYVNEGDVEEVVAYIKNINSAYNTLDSEKIVNEIEREAQKCGAVSGKKGGGSMADDGDGDEDPMLKSAVELAIDSGKISTSLIQRRLSLGYGRAAKLIDRMTELGYVSPPDGQKPRDVLITKAEYMEMRLRDEAPFDL